MYSISVRAVNFLLHIDSATEFHKNVYFIKKEGEHPQTDVYKKLTTFLEFYLIRRDEPFLPFTFASWVLCIVGVASLQVKDI